MTRTLETEEEEEGELGREEEGAGIEVVRVVEDKALVKEEKVSYIIRIKSIRTILKTNYYLISMPFAARRVTIKPIVICTRGFKLSISRNRRLKGKEKLKEI